MLLIPLGILDTTQFALNTRGVTMVLSRGDKREAFWRIKLKRTIGWINVWVFLVGLWTNGDSSVNIRSQMSVLFRLVELWSLGTFCVKPFGRDLRLCVRHSVEKSTSGYG